MTLADQIINHGPYGTRLDAVRGGMLVGQSAAELNALRDELLELRRLRAAAEARERFKIDPLRGGDDDPDSLALYHDRPDCLWEAYPDASATLAELVWRADQHTKDCP